MPISNRKIIRNSATLETDDVTSGLLNPEQSRRFLTQAFEQTTLMPLTRREFRTARSGEIDKIGIAGRILRGKTENTDDGYRAKPTYGDVKYQTVAVRVPWEITEETLRENIEGESHEATITNLMTRQVGLDTEDLCLNGDEAVPAKTTVPDGESGTKEIDTPDYDFIKLNDGWIKQIKTGGHVVDHSKASMSIDVFYEVLRSLPNKYNNGKLRWLMSPHRQQEWERYILDKAITVGGIISDRRVENPCSIPAVPVANMPDDCLLLTDPQNLITVATYNMRIRKTTEGKEAIMQDKRFYVIHFDIDAIIEELDATAIVTNLNELH